MFRTNQRRNHGGRAFFLKESCTTPKFRRL